MRSGLFIEVLVFFARIVMFFWHPVFRVIGREHVKKEGRLMICANHSGAADPIWIIFALNLGHIPRIMAKKQITEVPGLGWLLQKFGVIGVDREQADIRAVKAGLRCLNNDQQLMIFPEGTRVKPGKTVKAKRGAVTLAARTNTPILPVYLTPRKPFSPITCVIGEPYILPFEGKKATDEELHRCSDELMEKIYRLGECV